VSPERAKLIDDAIDTLLREQNARIEALLTQNLPLLDSIATRLLEKKSLTKDEVAAMVADHKTRKIGAA
jgi:ATP-dependent Zn protease